MERTIGIKEKENFSLGIFVMDTVGNFLCPGHVFPDSRNSAFCCVNKLS